MQMTCETEVNTKVTYDPRYKIMPTFFASEASVQEENGVSNIISEIDPVPFGLSGIVHSK